MSDPERFQRTFFARLDPQLHLATLFDFLPEVYFYAKDRQSRFVKANQALVALRGLSHEREMIGRSDFELHPRYLAEQYVAEDRRVMQSARPLPNQVWLVPDEAGQLQWYVSSKIPLWGRTGKVIGIAGAMRDLQKFEHVYRPYQEMDDVLRYVLDHFSERIEVPELAALAHLSVSQFDRRFKSLFQMTPVQYILRVRINAASRALTATRQTVAQISVRCGFYDQSYFTKQFRKETGMTPLAFRQHYSTRPHADVQVSREPPADV